MSQSDHFTHNLLLLVCKGVHTRFECFSLQVANQLCILDFRSTLAILIIIVALVIHSVQICL